MLLVDDGDAEAGEAHRILDQGMGPDDQRQLPAGQLAEQVSPPAPGRGSGQQSDRDHGARHELLDGGEVLLGQRLGWCHQRAQILVDLGLTSIRILTNNPKKISGLAGYGLSVTDQIPIQHVPNPHNEAYLRAKRDRLGHTLHHQGLALDEEMLHDEHEHDRPAPAVRAREE